MKCKECGNEITIPRARKFCSKKCREKNSNKRYNDSVLNGIEKKRASLAKIQSDDKMQCQICGL